MEVGCLCKSFHWLEPAPTWRPLSWWGTQPGALRGREWNRECCPIHPTRVDSSLVLAIWQTWNRFGNPIPWNRHELFPLLSICHAGSRFARDFQNIVDLDFEGGLKMLSIQVNLSHKSTEVCGHVLRTRKVHVSLFHGSWLLVGYTGWLKMLLIRVDSIESTWIVSPVVDLSCQK